MPNKLGDDFEGEGDKNCQAEKSPSKRVEVGGWASNPPSMRGITESCPTQLEKEKKNRKNVQFLYSFKKGAKVNSHTICLTTKKRRQLIALSGAKRLLVLHTHRSAVKLLSLLYSKGPPIIRLINWRIGNKSSPPPAIVNSSQ